MKKVSRMNGHVVGNPNGQDVRKLVLGICGIRGNQLEPGGCCLLIAPGLAITAKHVINHIDEKFVLTEPKPGGNLRDYAIHVSASRALGHITFEVETVYQCANSDLALLQVRALNEESYTYPVVTPSINFDPPPLGSEVFTFGYPRQTAQLDEGFIVWESQVFSSLGHVQEYWPERRDAAVLTFPSFQLDAEVIGHMSGGPIANRNGEIVGVIAGGLDDGEGGRPISYGAALWPLLGTRMFDPKTGTAGNEYYFFDLFTENYLPGSNWNHPQYNRRDPLFLATVPRPSPRV
jgi:S1-C subfamily serine protease